MEFFNVAADEPHWDVTHRLLELARKRSVAARARSIDAPPALRDPALVALGAGHYVEMCVDCHLGPGIESTELRDGMYPRPPNLAAHRAPRNAAETFWIIKHGLKMTGMPAWGITHDDHDIWGLVAFLGELPTLSAEEFAMIASAPDAPHTHAAGAHVH